MIRAKYGGVFLFAAIIFFALSAGGFAEEAKKDSDSGNIEQLKAKIMANLDARIKLLQDERSCVSSAQTKDDLRKCRQTSREEHKKLRDMMMQQKK